MHTLLLLLLITIMGDTTVIMIKNYKCKHTACDNFTTRHMKLDSLNLCCHLCCTLVHNGRFIIHEYHDYQVFAIIIQACS